jgi:hypothetical protein
VLHSGAAIRCKTEIEREREKALFFVVFVFFKRGEFFSFFSLLSRRKQKNHIASRCRPRSATEK